MVEETALPGADLWGALRRSGLTVRELWLRYLTLGGNADEVAVEAQLHGLLQLLPGEYNVLAHAINEALDDVPPGLRHPKVAYARPSAADRRSGR